MTTIDAQVHTYERNHPGRPWVGALHGPPEVTGDQMVAAMDSVGVDGAATHRFGLIKPVDPTDPAVAEIVADLPRVLALATLPNVAIKITGAGTLSHEAFPFQDIWEPLGRIFDAFDLDRCLWGTDWTRAVALLTYAQGVEAFRVTDRLSDSERARLMGGTLTRIYRWAPTSATPG
jgi:predicted TIM-barrel fold metal-dependent hydrolase